MKNFEVGRAQLRLKLTSAQSKMFLLGFVFLAVPLELGSENITLSTTYPSPVGIYHRLITTGSQGSPSGDTILARDGGRVGVGTAMPVDQFHIYSNTPFTGTGPVDQMVLEGGDAFGNGGGYLRLQGNNPLLRFGSGLGASGFRNFQIQNGGGGFLSLGSNEDDWSWKNGSIMTWTSNGNVGIGTISPAQKLSVAGTVESSAGGFKFPDGSLQTTAAGRGFGGMYQVSNRGCNTNNPYTGAPSCPAGHQDMLIFSSMGNNTCAGGAWDQIWLHLCWK